ncbi:MAG: aldehyde dehydrogenase family protein, partial [Desulfobacterales bacterium]|nr:aldehyde dehydrogenase family protein [Desulfobacterales bacterium]
MDKKILIGGEWVEAKSNERVDIMSPGDGSRVGSVPLCAKEDVDLAVDAALEGRKALKKMSLLKRVELLHKAMEIAKTREKETCEIMCRESGKPMAQSISEASPGTGYSWSNFHVAMGNIKTFMRGIALPNVTEDNNNKRILQTFEPINVVANISTYSYPSEMPNCTIPYALALGTAVIVKPSIGTPLSAILIAEALHEAGFPAGAINIVTGTGAEVGNALVTNPGVSGINSFTSEAVCHTISQNVGMKRHLAAVVSNNPFIVMDDANIDEAVLSAAQGAYGHNGQSPISTRRILVHKEVYTEYLNKFVEKTQSMVFGDPMDEKTDIGPLNNKVVLAQALEHLEDAKSKGGKFLTGGNAEGLYLEPTVIDNATPDMLVTTEPTMGPVVPVMPFEDIEQAVEMANDSRFGFQVGAFTSSLANAYFLSENIEAGSVYINEATSC